jgi:hypothetical protein
MQSLFILLFTVSFIPNGKRFTAYSLLISSSWVGHVARMGDRRGASCMVLVGRPDGKRALRRPTSKWEDNIKMDVEELGWGLIWLRRGTCGRRYGYHKMQEISSLRTS